MRINWTLLSVFIIYKSMCERELKAWYGRATFCRTVVICLCCFRWEKQGKTYACAIKNRLSCIEPKRFSRPLAWVILVINYYQLEKRIESIFMEYLAKLPSDQCKHDACRVFTRKCFTIARSVSNRTIE